jgi:hypothetical protein
MYSPVFSSIPGKGEIFLFSTPSRPALGPTQSPNRWEQGAISTEVKRPELEADQSPPFSAEVKNGGAIAPLSHISPWHSVKLMQNSDTVYSLQFINEIRLSVCLTSCFVT